MRILIVEDDSACAAIAAKSIFDANMQYDIAEDCVEAEGYLDNYDYDCIVLDLMLPDVSGLEILEKIRNNSVLTPVIITSGRADIQSIQTGYSVGADNYLTKPYSPQELISCIGAIIRRNNNMFHMIKEYPHSLKYNMQNMTLSYCSNSIPLRKKEAEIFKILAERINQVVSQETIMKTVYWDHNTDVDRATIHNWMHRLKKKISTLTDGNLTVSARRGSGYILSAK